ncbi:MAG: ribbon-helix-helix domain-containing protein [Cystobacterineae bacterium]|nr:ribbon-helix-helix domain-containing protein [Cystobacterineae bacterium]
MEPTKERLLSIVFRLNDVKLRSLKQLARRTRIRQSEYLREAIADLLSKYGDKHREV